MKSNSVLCADIATPMQKTDRKQQHQNEIFKENMQMCSVFLQLYQTKRTHIVHSSARILKKKFYRLVTVGAEKSPSGQEAYTGSQSCLKALMHILPPHTALSCQETISTQN
jgi:hypothetical protein